MGKDTTLRAYQTLPAYDDDRFSLFSRLLSSHFYL
jgi:hypothetical protein